MSIGIFLFFMSSFISFFSVLKHSLSKSFQISCYFVSLQFYFLFILDCCWFCCLNYCEWACFPGFFHSIFATNIQKSYQFLNIDFVSCYIIGSVCYFYYFFNFLKFLFFLMCVFVCVYLHVCSTVRIWKSEDHFAKYVLFSMFTWILRMELSSPDLWGICLSSLSHPHWSL